MLLNGPDQWSVIDAPKVWIATPDDTPGGFHRLSVWLDRYSGRAFSSYQQLKAYVAVQIAPKTHSSVSQTSVGSVPGPVVLVSSDRRGHFYRDYWILYGYVAYIFHAQGTNAYLAAHPRTVAHVLASIAFDSNDLGEAYSAEYLGHWTARLGGSPSLPALTITVSDFDLAPYGYTWGTDLAMRVHGSHSVTIESADLVVSQTADDLNVPPAGTEPGLFVSSSEPFTLTLHANDGCWDSIFGSRTSPPQPGNYGSLRITYTIDGRAGTYTFPTLQRPAGQHTRQTFASAVVRDRFQPLRPCSR